LIEHGLEHVLQKLPSSAPVRLFKEFGCGELTRETDADTYIYISIRRLDFSNINVE
jgi:hypothetical protein